VKTGDLRELLDRHGLHLSRDLGQNFLTDADLALDLARRAGAREDDFVIEVGTGLGVLTRAIAGIADRVRTVEVDAGLVRALEAESLLPENVELVHADAREINWRAWIGEAEGRPVRLIANLPYSVATPLLRTLLDLRDALADWSVMIQSEVAERLVASTGDRAYGSLTVLHRLATDVDRIARVPPSRFFPQPKVDSSFVRVWPRAKSPLREGELAAVERLTRAAFGQRRKRVTNGLARIAERAFPGLEKAERREALEARLCDVGIDPSLRPERIEPEAWLALSRAFAQDELGLRESDPAEPAGTSEGPDA